MTHAESILHALEEVRCERCGKPAVPGCRQCLQCVREAPVDEEGI